MLWIEKKYINFLSPRLQKFKWVTADTANFRCPICGDSKKDKNRARAYLFLKKSNDGRLGYKFFCHNCIQSLWFRNFIYTIDPIMAKEFRFELFKESGTQLKREPRPQPVVEAKVVVQAQKSDLNNPYATNCQDLPYDHIAIQYLKGRSIPETKFSNFYYTPNFAAMCQHQVFNDTTERLPRDERICLFLRDKAGEVVGVVGRVIEADDQPSIRYLTIKFNETSPKLFGLDKFDREKSGFVLEGAIDSLFLPNALALCGSAISFETLGSFCDPAKTYFVLDNEPRSVPIVENMISAAKNGYNVVIWNGIDPSKKDINKMVEAGLTVKDILQHIANNSFAGIKALAAINQWKKIK